MLVKQNSYIFIGMSGSGKTTLGKIIAQEINYQFIDSDQLIEKKFNGLNLYRIVERYRNDLFQFIELERKILNEINQDRSVLATGGSACYSAEVIQKKKAKVIYLHISWELLVKRIGDFSQRGVILFQKSLEQEYRNRIKIYNNLACLKIDCDGKSVEKLKKEILNKI